MANLFIDWTTSRAVFILHSDTASTMLESFLSEGNAFDGIPYYLGPIVADSLLVIILCGLFAEIAHSFRIDLALPSPVGPQMDSIGLRLPPDWLLW